MNFMSLRGFLALLLAMVPILFAQAASQPARQPAPGSGRVVVAFGDSITQGAGAVDDHGRPVRYPEKLEERLSSGPRGKVSVANAGIPGNRLLADSVGPKGIDRFEHDALDLPGETHVIILIGINDIGFSLPEGAAEPVRGKPSAAEITDGLQRLIDMAHAHQVKVLLGTLTPFEGASYWTPEKERRRAAVNDWIRHRGAKDVVSVVDFDAVLRDPARPSALKAVYDSGDHLHPANAGYAAMANAIDLRALAP
jgi:lysophospholipase L1-like esterase